MASKRTHFFICCFIIFCSSISMIDAARGDGFNIYKALLRAGKNEDEDFVDLVDSNDDDLQRLCKFP